MSNLALEYAPSVLAPVFPNMRRSFSRPLIFAVLLAATAPVRAQTPVEKPGRVITLDAAYDRALTSDQSIRQAYWEIRKANLEPLSALTRIAPSIVGSGNLATNRTTTRTRTTETVFDPVDTSSSSTRNVTRLSRNRGDVGSMGITYQQTLLDLTVIPAFRIGKLSAQAARLTYSSTIRSVLYGLAQSYYEVLKQQKVMEVSRQTLKLAEEQLALAEIRANAGEVTRSDVLRAQVTVESDRRILIEAENLLTSRRNSLANILNVDPGVPFDVAEPPVYSTALPAFESLLNRAMIEREDLRVQSIAIEQDQQRRNQIIAEYAPRIVGQVSADRNERSGTSDSSSHSWDASLSVQVPFFTGGQREIDLARSGYQINQTKLAYEVAAKNVQQEVKDAWLLVSTLAQTLKATHTQVDAAEQAYLDIQNQYKAGTATSVDVLSALNELNVARRDLATQTYDYQVALRNVDQATGVFQNERVKRLKFR